MVQCGCVAREENLGAVVSCGVVGYGNGLLV